MDDDAQKRFERLDKVAGALLDLIEATPIDGSMPLSAKQKSDLFSQVVAWYKVRKTLAPDGGGDKIKEMANEFTKPANRGGKRSPRVGIAPGKASHAIRTIINRLPDYGNGAERNTQSAERAGRGADRNDGGVSADADSDVSGLVDESRHLN